MSKPSVYVDTNVFSFLYYRGADTLARDKRRVTREWWGRERGFYRLFASRAVEDELAAGKFPG